MIFTNISLSYRNLSLTYTTQKSHQQAKRSLATTVCALIVIAALEHLAIALTPCPMSHRKLQLRVFWLRMFCTWKHMTAVKILLMHTSHLGEFLNFILLGCVWSKMLENDKKTLLILWEVGKKMRELVKCSISFLFFHGIKFLGVCNKNVP